MPYCFFEVDVVFKPGTPNFPGNGVVEAVISTEETCDQIYPTVQETLQEIGFLVGRQRGAIRVKRAVLLSLDWVKEDLEQLDRTGFLWREVPTDPG